MDAILEQFLNEARDNLSYLDRHLAELENGDEETINALFRAAHTLKGGAGLVGFISVKEITHKAEDLLDAYRNKKISYSSEMTDALYEAFDEVVELIDAVEEDGTFAQPDENRIRSITENISKFLNKDLSQKEKTDSLETQLNLLVRYPDSSNLLFEEDLADFVDELPLELPSIESDYLEQKHYYLLDMDLDQQTIEFGNDPIYLLYLLGEENIKALSVISPSDCADTLQNPLQWKTRIIVVVKSDAQTIEDTFYNILDEVEIYPLCLKSLLFSHKKDEKFIKTRISTLKNIIDEENRKKLLEYLSNELGYKIKEDISTKNGETTMNEKEIEVIREILSQQKLILSLESLKNGRKSVKKTLSHLFGYADMENFKARLNENDSLTNIIDDALSTLETPQRETAVTGQNTNTNDSKKTNTGQQKKETTHLPKTVKIDQQDIDLLLNTVGELLVMKNALPYLAQEVGNLSEDQLRREILGKYEEISRVTEQLQEKIMNMRLLPLSYIFGRYPKMVRDIGKKLNKKIRYEESGGETKLDKTMIEKLADPLIHLIRNSLDHGLESEQERIKLEKDPTGVIKIEARSQADRVFITIEDDGRGIDVDKVVHKALEKQLINPDTADALSRDEKLMLIFHPGLSTKDEISDLSGRGVGADAVKKTIEELGGKIFLKSRKNRGTVLTMELPVSVALSNVFHVKMNENNYAIDMDRIVETVQVEKDQIQKANHRPFINLRGKLIPLLYEKTLLGEKKEDKKQQNIVVLEGENNTHFGLVVDNFVNQLDVVQKPLSGSLKSHPLISGTSLLGNGDVLFILDPLKIVSQHIGGKQ